MAGSVGESTSRRQVYEPPEITENSIVGASEEASWRFSRALFTRFPAEVGRMTWWSQAIGLAWRVVHGAPPMGTSSREKRSWADVHVAGWELLPMHSQSAGFSAGLDDVATGSALMSSMRGSLRLAIRFPSDITTVASKVGSRLTNELATTEDYPELKISNAAFPTGTKAYGFSGRLLLSLPRQLVSKYSGTKFEEISSAIRRLRDQAAKTAG